MVLNEFKVLMVTLLLKICSTLSKHFCYITICQIQLWLWRPHDKYDTGKLVMHLETFRTGVGCGIDTNIIKKNPRLCFFFLLFFVFLLYEKGSLCIGVTSESSSFTVKLS